MQQYIDYTTYARQFRGMHIQELVTVFNSQVGSRAWTGMRACHDKALLDEFRRRGVDITAVADGRTVSFARPVSYDRQDNKLVTLS